MKRIHFDRLANRKKQSRETEAAREKGIQSCIHVKNNSGKKIYILRASTCGEGNKKLGSSGCKSPIDCRRKLFAPVIETAGRNAAKNKTESLAKEPAVKSAAITLPTAIFHRFAKLIV